MGDFDDIKKDSWNMFYDSRLQEDLSEALIRRWSQIDMGTKFLILITATGSAIAGWSLWSTPEGKVAWGMIAGIACVSSIANNVMGVPDRLKKQEEIRTDFLKLSLDIETFRQRLKSDADLISNPKEVNNKYLEFRNKFTECMGRIPSDDIGITKRFYDNIQNNLNEQLKNEGKI